MSPARRPASPPPILRLGQVPNIEYFRAQWVLVKNLDRLKSKLWWETIKGSGIKWLTHSSADRDEESGPFGLILLGRLGPFVPLSSAENNFDPNKPEISIQLEVEEESLSTLQELIRQRDSSFTVTNPLRIKIAQSDIASPSFTPGDPFPDTFDGTSTDDDQDGDLVSSSSFKGDDVVRRVTNTKSRASRYRGSVIVN